MYELFVYSCDYYFLFQNSAFILRFNLPLRLFLASRGFLFFSILSFSLSSLVYFFSFVVLLPSFVLVFSLSLSIFTFLLFLLFSPLFSLFHLYFLLVFWSLFLCFFSLLFSHSISLSLISNFSLFWSLLPAYAPSLIYYLILFPPLSHLSFLLVSFPPISLSSLLIPCVLVSPLFRLVLGFLCAFIFFSVVCVSCHVFLPSF